MWWRDRQRMWRRGSRSLKRSRHCLQLLFSSKVLLFSLIWFAVVCIITRSVTRISIFPFVGSGFGVLLGFKGFDGEVFPLA